MAANDTKNLTIINGSFRAKTALPGASPALPASYDIDFGAFEKGTIKISGDLKESWRPGPGGALGLDALRRTKARLAYEFDEKYLSKEVFERIFGTPSGGAPAPGKVIELFGIVTAQGEGELVQSDGSAIFNHHSFKAALTYDGDLTMDGENYVIAKLKVEVLLGAAPGIMTFAASRPVPTVGG